MICHPSVPPGIAIHKPARRAFICQMTSSTTVVTDHQRTHAIPTHMTQLLAVPAYNVAVTTAANTTTTTTTPPCSPIMLDLGHCLATCPATLHMLQMGSFGQSRARWPVFLQLLHAFSFVQSTAIWPCL
jgi:hypothetical protein